MQCMNGFQARFLDTDRTVHVGERKQCYTVNYVRAYRIAMLHLVAKLRACLSCQVLVRDPAAVLQALELDMCAGRGVGPT